MSIRLKIILLIMVIVIPPTWLFVDVIINDLKPEYRKSTEEPLVDIAVILAAIAAESFNNSEDVNFKLLETTIKNALNQKFNASIYSHVKEQIDLRIYITNKDGILLFDSLYKDPIGTDYSDWRDVQLTIAGKYGARTSKEDSINKLHSMLYVAAPIIVNDQIAGVLSVGKPSETVNLFVKRAKYKIILVGLFISVLTLLLGLLVSYLITKPIEHIKKYVLDVSSSKRPLPPKFLPPEFMQLSDAVELMRNKLEGKEYVENYVLNLTHEIKSPLAAIQGAGELLKEDPPDAQKEKFLANILEEAKRIESLVEKLLLLTRIEAKKFVEDFEEIDLNLLLQEIKESLNPVLEKKNLNLVINSDTQHKVLGDTFLLRHAILNLIQNAIDFSPTGKEIACTLENDQGQTCLKILDSGNGIPDYALDRLFERFYSLPRPDGRKSSGLGLSLVREVMSLLGASVEINNRTIGGVEAVVRFKI